MSETKTFFILRNSCLGNYNILLWLEPQQQQFFCRCVQEDVLMSFPLDEDNFRVGKWTIISHMAHVLCLIIDFRVEIRCRGEEANEENKHSRRWLRSNRKARILFEKLLSSSASSLFDEFFILFSSSSGRILRGRKAISSFPRWRVIKVIAHLISSLGESLSNTHIFVTHFEASRVAMKWDTKCLLFTLDEDSSREQATRSLKTIIFHSALYKVIFYCF